MINNVNTKKIYNNFEKVTLSNSKSKIVNKDKIIEKGFDWGWIYLSKNIILDSLIENFYSINEINQKDVSDVQNAAKQTIKHNKKLNSNNLKLIYLNNDNLKNLEPDLQKNETIKLIIEGKNAGFSSKTNKILIPEKKLQLSIFHEIGHAINFNCSKFWQNVYKYVKYSSAFMYLIFGEKILKKKNSQQNSSSKKDALVVTTTKLPILIEEGIASFKGNREAKKLLNKDLYKKIVKINKIGFATYAINFGFTYISFKMLFDLKNLIQKK